MVTFLLFTIIFVLSIITIAILGGIGIGTLCIGFGDVIAGIIIVILVLTHHRKRKD